MGAKDQLQIAAGFATRTGRRTDNRDFGIIDVGSASQRVTQGAIAAVADGFGGLGGRVASELAVRAFVDGYRAQNEPVGVATAAMKSLNAYNLWLHGQSRSDPALFGAATTFTAAILRGRVAMILHVGDSRAWHLRENQLNLITDDHYAPQTDSDRRLLRAVGLEPALRLDVDSQPLKAHDRLLLTTRGVHSVLSARTLLELLNRRQDPQTDADAIVEAACEAGSEEDATALVIDIITVPAPDYSAVVAEMQNLPIRDLPEVGDTVDGFKLVRVLAESKTARLFLALDQKEWIVLKFPDPKADQIDRAHFMREVFLGQRIRDPNVGASLTLPDKRQSRLYVAMPYYRGETLEDRLGHDGPMKIDEAVAIAIKIGRGLIALHKAGVTHRDIKPGNVMLLKNGDVKIFDLGVARLPRFDDIEESGKPWHTRFHGPGTFPAREGRCAVRPIRSGRHIVPYSFRTLPLWRNAAGRAAALRCGFAAIWISQGRSSLAQRCSHACGIVASRRSFRRYARVYFCAGARKASTAAGAPSPADRAQPLVFWQLLCALLFILLVLSLVLRMGK